VNSIGSSPRRARGVAVHHTQIGANHRGEVGLVDHEQVGGRHTRPALRGTLSPPATSITKICLSTGHGRRSR